MLLRLLLLLGLLLPAVLGAQEPEPIKAVREIRALDRVTAGKGLPVLVRGVVTFASPGGAGSFILNEGDTGIYVATGDAVARGLAKPDQDFAGPLQLGMLVEVDGVTSPGGYAPVIIPRKIRHLGSAPLPPVKRVAVADLQTGRFDCERVRVRGVVQRAEFTNRAIDAVRLELAAVGGHFVGYAMSRDGFDLEKLVDAEVDLSGLALTFFNERAELVGTRVQMQSIADVEVVRAAPEHPFAAPEGRLEALLPFSPDPPSLHRRRFKGTVTVSRPGAYFYIQEGDRAVRVTTQDPTPLAPGERVEVSGFVELWEYFAEIREAVFRKLGTGALPEPEPVTRSMVLAAKPWLDPPRGASHLDGRRVVLRGKLEKVETGAGVEPRISLDCDGQVVFATLANEGAAMTRLEPGSEVSVTGVCQIQLSVGRPTLRNPVPTGFQLLVHSPEDIAVLNVPPWWTPRRLWLALAWTGGVLALAVGWAWLLRRKVAQRSAQLAAEMGARRNAALEFEATLRERKRLAADLHDTLEQALTGLALQLEAVDLFRAEDPARSARHLHLAQQFLARSREDVRRSVWNLRAQGLEGRTLFEALETMVAALTEGQSVESACELQGEAVTLPDFIAGNLLLLAQEAVTNAVKHAGAREIRVRVAFGGEGVTLEVKDDGKGFAVESAPGLQEGHFGLQGMRERVKRLGGTVRIESAPGAGTLIRAQVPMHAFDEKMEVTRSGNFAGEKNVIPS